MTAQQLKIAVVGAGKMGMRVSDNLQRSTHDVRYVENSPAGQQRTLEAGRTPTDIGSAVRDADVVILAVPDIALGPVSEQLVPQLQPGTIVLTLDPAAAYANLLYRAIGVHTWSPTHATRRCSCGAPPRRSTKTPLAVSQHPRTS